MSGIKFIKRFSRRKRKKLRTAYLQGRFLYKEASRLIMEDFVEILNETHGVSWIRLCFAVDIHKGDYEL